MDEPRPDELVMVGGLPELIKPLAHVLANGLRQLSGDLAALLPDASTSRRQALLDDLQAPLGFIEDLGQLPLMLDRKGSIASLRCLHRHQRAVP